MRIKLPVIVTFLLVLAVSAQKNAMAQSDTLVFRRDSIDISRGRVGVRSDTIAVTVDTAKLIENVPLDPERYFRKIENRTETVTTVARKQTAADFIARGDSLRRECAFRAAMDSYRRAMALSDNADVHRRMSETQNALTLSEFCSDPVPIARARFSVRDFYLFYPMKGSSWRAAPNPLDSLASGPVSATYVPKDEKNIYFSASREGGPRNIYFTRSNDTLWSAPVLVDAKMTTSGNEIYPLLSADGKTLYFSSDALYGMGGYDLYRCDWDDYTHRWSEPINMGFPYSSPGDDFLFYNTEDGKYSIFASNRACSPDSVYLYVLNAAAPTGRRAITAPSALRDLIALKPVADPTLLDTGSAVESADPESDNTRLYREKAAVVSSLRDSIYLVESSVDGLRMDLPTAGDPSVIAARISALEARLPGLRSRLAAAQKDVQDIEMAFLSEGTQKRNRIRSASNREVVGAGSAYTFTKNSLGPRLKMKFAASPSVTRPDFRVSPVGRFARTTTLPGGLVFQIYMFSSPSHASVEDLGGLSPVYERLTSSLQYTYSVGVFYTYADALAELNTVRSLGFPDAHIVAYRDGRQVHYE